MKKYALTIALLLLLAPLAFAGPKITIGGGNGSGVALFVTVEKSADAVSLTVTESTDTLVTNRGWDGADDQTFTLPEADDATSAGAKFVLLGVKASTATADTYIDTEGATTNIYLNGIAIGDGERVWIEEIAIGDSIRCYAATIDGSTYDWFCDSINGLWLDKGS